MARLEQHIDSIISPILASSKRKTRMREELLTHLRALYDEELARTGDAQQAEQRAIERFGDRNEMLYKLVEAIPMTEQLAMIPMMFIVPVGKVAGIIAGIVIVLAPIYLIYSYVEKMLAFPDYGIDPLQYIPLFMLMLPIISMSAARKKLNLSLDAVLILVSLAGAFLLDLHVRTLGYLAAEEARDIWKGTGFVADIVVYAGFAGSIFSENKKVNIALPLLKIIGIVAFAFAAWRLFLAAPVPILPDLLLYGKQMLWDLPEVVISFIIASPYLFVVYRLLTYIDKKLPNQNPPDEQTQ